MTSTIPFPPGFDPDIAFTNIEAPVFIMSRTWVAEPLSLAAVGFLTRFSALEQGESLNLTRAAGGDNDLASSIRAELIAAGFLVDGRLVDPVAEADALLRAAMPKPVQQSPVPLTIYYLLREPDGAVKIGITSNLATRIRTLEKVYGPLTLLAVEDGWPVDENARHRQFDKLRLAPDLRFQGGTEWFHTGRALVRHIEALRTGQVAA